MAIRPPLLVVTPPPSGNNIARHVALMADVLPDTPALKIPRGRPADGRIDYLTLSFAELDAEVDAWCRRLLDRGIRPGDRTLVMVRQGLPLIAAAFALFKIGAVPVIIDPGMGLKSFLACVERSRPRALVGIPLALVLSRVFRKKFRSLECRVSARSSLTARLTRVGETGGVASLRQRVEVAAVADDALAAILFTSGSTGSPKGVCYEHGMFEAQVRLIRKIYEIKPGEVDLPMLPIFALFNPALGMTTIVPEIDPRRPADVDPAKIVQAIEQEGVTNSFGSPTLWRKIGSYCLSQKIELPGLRRVLCAGAPVPASLWRDARSFLSHGELYSPYGATEALPVSSVSGAQIAAAHGAGACVGRAVPEVYIKIIAPVDGPITAWRDIRELPPFSIGEIVVAGPVVTKRYDALPAAIALAKIPEGDRIWHRLGDCGYMDADQRLWFCGRKVERVQDAEGVLYTEPCEQVFRGHPRAARCALIGLGVAPRQTPALVVEAHVPDPKDARALAAELRALGREHAATARIETFFFHPKFRVDVRHNAKIHRLALARWAITAPRYSGDTHS